MLRVCTGDCVCACACVHVRASCVLLCAELCDEDVMGLRWKWKGTETNQVMVHPFACLIACHGMVD